MRLVLMGGSLRTASLNARLLRHLARELEAWELPEPVASVQPS